MPGASCIPDWIHPILAERHRALVLGIDRKGFKKPGCTVNSAGYVPCSPESLRAYTEDAVKRLGLMDAGRDLSLDAYSLARNVRSEAGSGSLPEKVAMAQVAINRMRAQGKTISQMTMRDGRWYAQQSGQNPSVATSKDPSWEDIVIAEMALWGIFEGWADGAVLYYSPNDQDGLYRAGRVKDDRWAIYERWTHDWGSRTDGYAWVGPLPGVNHNEQFLMRPVKQKDPAWRIAYDAGRAALRDKSTPAIARAPACSAPTRVTGSPAGLAATSAVAIAVGAATGYAFIRLWGPAGPFAFMGRVSS